METLALVVRRVPIAEADLMLTLVTRERGATSASARSARRPSSRLGALEPMHTLNVVLEVAPDEEIARLKEAKIVKPRLGLLSDERRISAASELLAMARRLVPAGARDPRTFDVLEEGLDALVVQDATAATLTWSRSRLLECLGYGLDLDRCIRCGTPCPEASAAYVDPGAGGLVCRACGGGPILLRPGQRARIATWLSAPELGPIDEEDERIATRIIELAVASHATRR